MMFPSDEDLTYQYVIVWFVGVLLTLAAVVGGLAVLVLAVRWLEG